MIKIKVITQKWSKSNWLKLKIHKSVHDNNNMITFHKLINNFYINYFITYLMLIIQLLLQNLITLKILIILITLISITFISLISLITLIISISLRKVNLITFDHYDHFSSIWSFIQVLTSKQINIVVINIKAIKLIKNSNISISSIQHTMITFHKLINNFDINHLDHLAYFDHQVTVIEI